MGGILRGSDWLIVDYLHVGSSSSVEQQGEERSQVEKMFRVGLIGYHGYLDIKHSSDCPHKGISPLPVFTQKDLCLYKVSSAKVQNVPVAILR